MDKDDDPWEILGVARDATEVEIKKAFRKGALKYHPDKQTTEEDKAAASDIFAKFSDAYDTLTDPVKRYDWKLANEKRANRSSSTASSNKPTPKTHASPSVPSHRTTPPAHGKRHSEGTSTKKRPDGSASNKKHPASATKRPSAPPPARRSGSATPPATGSHKQQPPSHPRGNPKRTSAPDQGAGRQAPHTSGKRMSAPPPPSSMGWRRDRKPGPGLPRPPPPNHRDPFDIFESVMKEEFGEDYKEKEESGWKASIGVPGLAKINPFRKRPSENSAKEFKKLDVNKDKTLSKDELGKYIESHSDLWATLGKNLGLSVKKCIEIATEVAFSLAFGEGISRPKKNEHRARHELSEAEFKHFHKNFVLDENGSHEFFLRTIFAVFDLNGDGVLSASELDRFLDVFYEAKDIFKGDMKLPEKKNLVRIVGKRLDSNHDGVLQFSEIRDLLEVAAVVTSSEKQ